MVLVIDVSGSMSPCADALLCFAPVLTRANPAVVEVFTLGTRPARVSWPWRSDPGRAVLAAGLAVPDFAGGTRLGETLRVFLDRWGRRGSARRAVITVFFDGWERGDPGLFAGLRRLAHAVFRVDPQAGRSGYAPVQSGIVAALPHIDRLSAGHSLAAWEQLLGEMADA